MPVLVNTAVVGWPYADAVFTARTTMFALLNVKMVFVLAFVRVFVTLMQGGFAFHDIEQRTSPTERRLDMCIFVFSLVKLFMSYKVQCRRSDRFIQRMPLLKPAITDIRKRSFFFPPLYLNVLRGKEVPCGLLFP